MSKEQKDFKDESVFVKRGVETEEETKKKFLEAVTQVRAAMSKALKDIDRYSFMCVVLDVKDKTTEIAGKIENRAINPLIGAFNTIYNTLQKSNKNDEKGEFEDMMSGIFEDKESEQNDNSEESS